MTLNEAIQIMTYEIVNVLADNKPTIYLFGSVALGDFQLGWSDIDILVLTECEISRSGSEDTRYRGRLAAGHRAWALHLTHG